MMRPLLLPFNNTPLFIFFFLYATDRVCHKKPINVNQTPTQLRILIKSSGAPSSLRTGRRIVLLSVGHQELWPEDGPPHAYVLACPFAEGAAEFIFN